MHTTSTCSKKLPLQNCTNIKAIALTETANKSGIPVNKSDCEDSEEKAVVIDIFRNQAAKISHKTKFTYTLKHGDDKRLNKEGVLRVYDLNKSVNIPVTELLGTWKDTHIGVTFVAGDNNWCLKGDIIKNKVTQHTPVLKTVVKQLLKLVIVW